MEHAKYTGSNVRGLVISKNQVIGYTIDFNVPDYTHVVIANADHSPELRDGIFTVKVLIHGHCPVEIYKSEKAEAYQNRSQIEQKVEERLSHLWIRFKDEVDSPVVLTGWMLGLDGSDGV